MASARRGARHGLTTRCVAAHERFLRHSSHHWLDDLRNVHCVACRSAHAGRGVMPGLSRDKASDYSARRQDDLRLQQLAYRIHRLPEQLERARNRVAKLEKEAVDLGIKDLLA